MNTLITKSVLASAIAFTIAGCTTEGSGDVAGIGGSGYVSSGSVSGFGSVFVNGVEFETDSSTFDVDGVSGTQDDLAIGMIVQVSGSINDDGVTGTATNISFDDELQGPVEALTDPDADGITRSFMVLGTNVIIDSSSTTFDIDDDLPANTVFGFDSITDNNNVEVSGFYDSNGNLKATRVELKETSFVSNSSIVEIEGIITNYIDDSNFKIRGTTVDATSATQEDLPNGLGDGQLVEVNGTYDTATEIIKATKVEAEDDSADDTDEFEIEGIIANYDDLSSTFTISGINVDASNPNLELEPTSLTLANDLHVEVEGSIVNGILVADEIESEGGDIKVHAMVSFVDVNTNTFRVKPVSNQPEITITVTTDTQLEDDAGDNGQFNLNNLNDTHFVEVRGFDDGNGGISAVEVDVKEFDDVIVQGYATAATGDAATGGTITVLGVTFDFDDGSITDFEKDSDIEGQPDEDLTTTEIDDLISAINVAPQLIKIGDDEVLNGVGNGVADEIEIESP